MAWVRARHCKLQKGCTRLTAASDKVYQLLAHGRWFSPGTPVSSTTKTGHHDIAEILLNVALSTIKSNQIKSSYFNYQCAYNHNPVLSSFMTYHRVCNESNTTGAYRGTGTAYPSGAHEFTTGFSGVRVARSLPFCIVFFRSCCRFSFDHCIVWSVRRFMASIGLLKLFYS